MIVCRAVAPVHNCNLPLFTMTIAAGPPSPVEDQIDDHIDLSQYLTPHPRRTFLVRVQGDSMVDAGINDGDLLVVEREAEAKNGDIVVAVVEGQFTVKTFRCSRGTLSLVPANKDCPDVLHEDFSVWGIARFSIRKL